MRFRMSTFIVGVVALCVGAGGVLVAISSVSPEVLASLLVPAGIALLVVVGLYYVSWMVWKHR